MTRHEPVVRAAHALRVLCAICAVCAVAVAPAPVLAAQVAPAPQVDPQPVPSVEVSAVKDPEMRNYRAVAAGMDAFDARHDLAPAAVLRFRLQHRGGPAANAADGLRLRLASDDGAFEQAIAVDADGRFTLARSRAAWDSDAGFILNQKRGGFSALPDIRTPGLPENVRRLGDLRLECRVTVAVTKEELPFLARAAVNTLLLTSDWCGADKLNFGLHAPARLAAVTLVAGNRSKNLPFRDWRYQAPIGDASWPDDARVELTYAADDAVTRTAGGTPRTGP